MQSDEILSVIIQNDDTLMIIKYYIGITVKKIDILVSI